MQDECSFSRVEVHVPTTEGGFANSRLESVVVECPECGAIRTVRVPRYGGDPMYPAHSRLDGSTRLKPRYKRVKDKWTWQEA